MVVIKFDYEGDVRRVTVENVPSFHDIQNLISSLYRENPQTYSLKYKDDDGDLITVASDREIAEAFRLFEDLNTVLRFQIRSLKDLTQSAIERELSPSSTSAATEEALHNAQCDVCRERIRGTRWRCKGCPDYDLCNKCYALEPRPHPQHTFARVEKRKKAAAVCVVDTSLENRMSQLSVASEELRRASEQREQMRAEEERMLKLIAEKERFVQEEEKRKLEHARLVALAEEQRRQAEEEQRRQLEQMRQAQEKERLRQQEEERIRRELEVQRQAEERARQLQEEAARRQEEIKRQEEEQKRQAEEKERQRIAKEEQERQQAERELQASLERERIERERVAQEEARAQKAKEDAAKAVEEMKTREMAKYTVQLQTLSEMGFCDVEKNTELLTQFKGDVMAVITNLLQ